ncbi:hypothetical protein K525DRAFT_231767 [Schizophyllum commune Loenen D]|nr:hypothetical protein K525DRAFT_231767 [Schizophyllum commune Loenen D]
MFVVHRNALLIVAETVEFKQYRGLPTPPEAGHCCSRGRHARASIRSRFQEVAPAYFHTSTTPSSSSFAMSAAVERPTPFQHDYPPQRAPPEVIDVDLLDDNDIHAARRNAARSEVITIDDDDDVVVVPDDDEIEFVGMSRAHSPAARPTRRLRSPPLRREPSEVPPVPPFPRAYNHWRPLPPRRSQYGASASTEPRDAGVVRPHDGPLPFEMIAEPGPSWRRLPPPRLPPPQPAPPAHATPDHPRMGFGGALLSENRRRNTRSGGGILQLIHTLAPGLGIAEEEDSAADRFLAFSIAFEGASAAPYRLFPSSRPDEPMYKSEYTHPESPEPGFTNDFGFGESDADPTGTSSSSSPAQTENVLQCTHCMRPLLLGDNISALGLEEERLHKLWGLRCGHMIDGFCFEAVSRPAPEDEVPAKGKGKGRARTRNNGLYMPIVEEDAAATAAAGSTPTSTRSRLRTRSSPRKRKRKGGPPTVEAEYEWACPVENCEYVHKSLKIDGQWIQHKDAGAVAIFV